MSDAVSIRRATPDDAPHLTEIARVAKASWGYPEDWMAEWARELTFSPEYIESNPVFAADVPDRSCRPMVAGVIALEVGESGPELAHLWVLPACQGSGIGRALVERAAMEARSRGWSALRILSDPNAVAFYERMGAVPVGSHPAPVAGTPRELPVLSLSTEGA